MSLLPLSALAVHMHGVQDACDNVWWSYVSCCVSEFTRGILATLGETLRCKARQKGAERHATLLHNRCHRCSTKCPQVEMNTYRYR
jgi:hypothetical protein